jgi:hypothetical protein
MLKLFCRITGDDYNLLKADTPESRKKVESMASVVFIPVIVWLFSGYLLVTQVLEGSVLSGLSVGFCMGFMVFLLEKNIIMAHGSKSILIFRICLGAVIALIGAICIDEVIFKNDIDRALAQINRMEVESDRAKVDEKFAAIITSKTSEVDGKFQAWQKALEEAGKEADATGGTGRRGVGPVTQMKLNIAASLQNTYEKSKTELEEITAKMEAERDAAGNRVSASQNDNALLIRIKALFRLVVSDWAMGIIYFLFMAFLFMLEFLVVFLKNSWPQTNYERRLELIEDIGRKRMDKVRQNDIIHFEPGRVYPEYKNASQQILRKTGSTSLFN